LVAVTGAEKLGTVVKYGIVAPARSSPATEAPAFFDAMQGNVRGVLVDGVGGGESTNAGTDDNECHNLPLALFNIYDYNYLV
jgi:hypothetical protein